ncbi:MAG: hypothetical protein Q8S21_05740 [Candidatus Paracaedibacteraceae bacterium]|nr:hypothetical protein [Candidatus Paracaedibacteraceae bacterium]
MIRSFFAYTYLWLLSLINLGFSDISSSIAPVVQAVPCVQGTPGCSVIQYSNGTTGYAVYPQANTYYPPTYPSSSYPTAVQNQYAYSGYATTNSLPPQIVVTSSRKQLFPVGNVPAQQSVQTVTAPVPTQQAVQVPAVYIPHAQVMKDSAAVVLPSAIKSTSQTATTMPVKTQKHVYSKAKAANLALMHCGEGGTSCEKNEACITTDNFRVCKHGLCVKGGASCKAIVPCPSGGAACWYTIKTIVGKENAGNAGDGDFAALAKINTPKGIVLDASHNLYIADSVNKNIRKVSAKTGIIKTLESSIGLELSALGIDKTGGLYTVNNTTHNIKKIETHSDESSVIMQNATPGRINGLVIASNGDVIFTDSSQHVVKRISGKKVDVIAGTDGKGGYESNGKKFSSPKGVAIAQNGDIYIADTGNHVIRKLKRDKKKSAYIDSVVAGEPLKAGFSGDGGKATDAKLSSPTDVDIDSHGNLYIADAGNHLIRVVLANSNKISTIAGRYEDDPKSAKGVGGFGGDGGLAKKAQLNHPAHIAVDGYGNVYVADEKNHRVRKIMLNVSTAN